MEWPLKTGIIYIYSIHIIINHYYSDADISLFPGYLGENLAAENRTVNDNECIRCPPGLTTAFMAAEKLADCALATRTSDEKTSWGCQFIYPVIYRVLKTSQWFGISEPSTVCYWKWLTSWRRHLAALAEAAWDWGVCDAGSYKTNNGNCAACPEGMTCPVGSEACRQVKSSLGLSKRPSLLSEWHFRS